MVVNLLDLIWDLFFLCHIKTNSIKFFFFLCYLNLICEFCQQTILICD